MYFVLIIMQENCAKAVTFAVIYKLRGCSRSKNVLSCKILIPKQVVITPKLCKIVPLETLQHNYHTITIDYDSM